MAVRAGGDARNRIADPEIRAALIVVCVIASGADGTVVPFIADLHKRMEAEAAEAADAVLVQQVGFRAADLADAAVKQGVRRLAADTAYAARARVMNEEAAVPAQAVFV